MMTGAEMSCYDLCIPFDMYMTSEPVLLSDFYKQFSPAFSGCFIQVFFLVLDYLTADWMPNVLKKF